MTDPARNLEYEPRLEAVQSSLAASRADAAVLFDRPNIRYLTGWRQTTAAYSALAVTSDTATYLVPALDEAAARAGCWLGPDRIRPFPEEGTVVDRIADVLPVGEIDVIGVEHDTISAERASRLRTALEADTEEIAHLVREPRRTKTAAEQAVYRHAACVTSSVMETTLDEVTPGMTEREAAARAAYHLESNGGERPSFEPFVMAGEHAWMPHRTPTSQPIDQGELVIIDMGLVWAGYATDITRTVVFGSPTPEQHHVVDGAAAAQEAAIAAVEPGVAAETVHQTAVDVLEDHGLAAYFPHLTGHGLGTALHEAPIIDEGNRTPLEPGMVVTIEPGVYKDGVGAARFEDMVLVTDDDHEVLTDAPRDPVLTP